MIKMKLDEMTGKEINIDFKYEAAKHIDYYYLYYLTLMHLDFII